MGEIVALSAEDGHTLAAYRATPQGKARGGLVIVQEIFGVNSHIRRVTDGFAADGYVALAPAIFDRAEPGFMTGYRQEDIDRGRAVRMKIPLGGAIAEHAQERIPTCRCTSIPPATASIATSSSSGTSDRRAGPC